MTRYVIEIAGYALGQASEFDGQYVSYYDPRKHGARGEIRVVPDAVDAIQFDDMGDVFEFYRQSYGVRPDGLPNRPLTAFNIVVVPVADLTRERS